MYIVLAGIFFGIQAVRTVFPTDIKGLLPVIYSFVLIIGGILYFAAFSHGGPFRMYPDPTTTGDGLTADVFYVVIGFGILASGVIAFISGVLQIILSGISISALLTLVLPIIFASRTSTSVNSTTGGVYGFLIFVMALAFAIWFIYSARRGFQNI